MVKFSADVCASGPEPACKIVPEPTHDLLESWPFKSTGVAFCQLYYHRQRVFRCLFICWLISIGIGVLLFVQPSPCNDIPDCVLALNSESTALTSTPQSRLAALSVLLAKELSALVQAHYEVPEMHAVAVHSRASLTIICIILAVKVVSELALYIDYSLPFAVPPMPGMLEDWGVMYWVRFFDWMVTAPLVLVLCGHYVLRRPMHEVIGPVVATTSYLYLAGMAMLASSLISRILLMIVAFATWVWVSIEMARWAYRFLCFTSPDIPRRTVRVVSTAALILAFGLYGIIYLLAIYGAISSATESEFYARGDVFCKISITFLISNVNEAERQHALRDLLFQSHDISSACMSLLRGSFDHVLPCRLDELGDLIIDVDAKGADDLEAILGRPVKGITFNGLIVAQKDRERFEAYTRHVLLNTRRLSPHTKELASCSSEMLQMSFSKQSLEMPTPAMANLFLCDLVGQTECWQCLDQDIPLRARIFLSPIDHRSSLDAELEGQRMVIAMTIDMQEVAIPSCESLPSTDSLFCRSTPSQNPTFSSIPNCDGTRQPSKASAGSKGSLPSPSSSVLAKFCWSEESDIPLHT